MWHSKCSLWTNDINSDFWFCNHLQPLALASSLAATWYPPAATWQPLATKKLASSCQVTGDYSEFLTGGEYWDFFAASSGKASENITTSYDVWRKRGFFPEKHRRNPGFLHAARRYYCILRTEEEVTCSHLAATCLGSHLQPLGSHLAATCHQIARKQLSSDCKWLQNGKSQCAPPARLKESCQLPLVHWEFHELQLATIIYIYICFLPWMQTRVLIVLNHLGFSSAPSRSCWTPQATRNFGCTSRLPGSSFERLASSHAAISI